MNDTAARIRADALISKVKEEAISTALQLGSHQRAVQAAIGERFGAPLAFLEVFVAFAREIQSDIRSAGTEAGLLKSSDRFLVETRLHARACQIAAEIITLLRRGFADGANARWRSLHEVASIAMFITSWEDDDRLAKRFMDFLDVEVYRLAEHRWQFRDREDVWHITEAEHLAAERRYEALLEQYGGPFGTPYGWATEAFEKSRVSFVTIETWVEMNHRRADYEIANGNVHAGPRGTLWRLGSPDMGNAPTQDGRSVRGLEGTMHATAISLNQATYGLYGAMVHWDWESRWSAQRSLATELGEMLEAIGQI